MFLLRLGEEQSLLERRSRESELLQGSLRCIVPCTNDEAAMKAFKDIAGAKKEKFVGINLIKMFYLQKF